MNRVVEGNRGEEARRAEQAAGQKEREAEEEVKRVVRRPDEANRHSYGAQVANLRRMNMAAQSQYLASLDEAGRKALEQRLLDRQSGRCFICNKLIDLVLHAGQLDIDHIIPRADIGPDEENNFAITHATCNRQKGASDLRVARRIVEFEELQGAAIEQGERGANLGHVLGRYNGGKAKLRAETLRRCRRVRTL